MSAHSGDPKIGQRANRIFKLTTELNQIFRMFAEQEGFGDVFQNNLETFKRLYEELKATSETEDWEKCDNLVERICLVINSLCVIMRQSSTSENDPIIKFVRFHTDSIPAVLTAEPATAVAHVPKPTLKTPNEKIEDVDCFVDSVQEILSEVSMNRQAGMEDDSSAGDNDKDNSRTNAKRLMLTYPTPDGATWEDVEIRFRDGHTVSVVIKEVKQRYTYIEMNMSDGRNKNPTKQWELLRIFAQHRGILTWNDQGADKKNQKRKEILSKNLIEFIGIDGDPFELTNDRKGWRTRFNITDE